MYIFFCAKNPPFLCCLVNDDDEMKIESFINNQITRQTIYFWLLFFIFCFSQSIKRGYEKKKQTKYIFSIHNNLTNKVIIILQAGEKKKKLATNDKRKIL